jgi:adenosylcobinamide amidohydrolase
MNALAISKGIGEVHEFVKRRVIEETLVLSFRRPVEVVSWALLNGGLRSDVAHIINHHVGARAPNELPTKTLRRVVGRLNLKGTVVGMMTAVDIRRHSVSRVTHEDMQACAVATAGCGNLATVGETGNFVEGKSQPMCVGTINLIVAVNYGFTHEAMLEALTVVTEAKVKAVFEAGLRSKANSELATGTGSDCVAIAAGSERRYRICGKHTKWGELIGRASLESVRAAIRAVPGDETRNGEAP